MKNDETSWKYRVRKHNPTSSFQRENIKRLLHSEVQNSCALYERIWGAPNKANSLEQAFVARTHHVGPQASKPDSAAIKVASLQNAGYPPTLTPRFSFVLLEMAPKKKASSESVRHQRAHWEGSGRDTVLCTLNKKKIFFLIQIVCVLLWRQRSKAVGWEMHLAAWKHCLVAFEKQHREGSSIHVSKSTVAKSFSS